ncbi:thioesterase family protein [Gilvimarinus sp. DA14]|uniref:acyl-CoA thioesterase n=1 Tax=Gilvimarinus sp. DA14 TaxID=2956798 RepID=UPI0020B7C790|nr:acyl-CoA thioesterase [Gilvimarinus sp. DA14]UTF59730.1 acyl-CoA thioesterase [Gilvimarinus sp. DA14]
MSKGTVSVAQTVKVPFYDVDSMGIVWHGHYIKYFEDARCALLDAFDYNYEAMSESGYGYPVVDLRLKYVKPARFNRLLKVVATLEEWEVRLKIDYRIIDLETGETLTKGHSVQVAVDLANGEMCFATPAVLQRKVAAYLGESDEA